MNYRLRKQGEDLGVCTLEELRRRRETGELTGAEYVQCEGRTDWQPLDFVLQQGYRVLPPPLPASMSRSGPNQAIIWLGIAGGIIFILFVVLIIAFFVNNFQNGFQSALNQAHQINSLTQPNPEAVAIAGRPIAWTNTTQTFVDAQKRAGEFRRRQWLDGYEKHGRRNPECDTEADLFLRTYIARNYGGPEATNSMSLPDESDKLAGDTNCTDPLVLTIAGDVSLNQFDARHRFERALAAYPDSSHKAYPQFYALVRLARLLGDMSESSDRAGALETSALQKLKECFADGSFTPADQQEIADIFVNSWGYSFFYQNAPAVCDIVKGAGPDYQWLSLTLNGEREISEAWAARGGGGADTVTDEGWRGFRSHLATARSDFTAAWTLQSTWPLAPERMIYVSLGDSDLQEMRVWFDRTTLAQIDYVRAWTDFRWGLRPRWYGNEQALLALGVSAINTRRFDTDVPRKYMDCVSDVESEMELPAGRHIYGRADIWPNLKRMYDGYVSAPSQVQSVNGWRSSYAIVAYLADKYPTSRDQLEALNWNLQNTSGWNVDLSLMPWEVAARTGSFGKKISSAESARNKGDISHALKLYGGLKNNPATDARTKQFIECRLSELSAEGRLQKGEWVSLLPSRDHDPDWVVSFGKTRVLPDGALEVESGPKGHMLFSHVRAGKNFEVRGQFEVVHSANENFQGGLVMGAPDFDGYNWYGFRLKRHGGDEGDVVCFAQGWSREQIARHVVLNDVTNTFDFTLQDGKVTASVNGVSVFDQAAAPVTLNIPDNLFLVGLGAFNDSPDTVIRYRNVQLKKL